MKSMKTPTPSTKRSQLEDSPGAVALLGNNLDLLDSTVKKLSSFVAIFSIYLQKFSRKKTERSRTSGCVSSIIDVLLPSLCRCCTINPWRHQYPQEFRELFFQSWERLSTVNPKLSLQYTKYLYRDQDTTPWLYWTPDIGELHNH